VFVSTKGHSYARFRRALALRDLDLIRHAAAELPRVPLADAAAVCALLADAEPGRFDRAACRWLARYCVETREVTLEAIDEALGAFQTMRDRPADSLVALRDLVERHP
jgi:hypothetical protein